MSGNLNPIIQLTILRQSKSTSQSGFSTVIVVGQYASFYERIRFYSTNELAELAKDVRKLQFDADLVTGNTIDMDVNGLSMSQVTFSSTHAATMALIITQLELLATVESAELDVNDATNRTLIIRSTSGVTNTTVTDIVVALGATQANGTYTDGTESPEYLAASAIASQSPKIPLIAIGREDSGDATMTATLEAIFLESQSFYGVITAERDLTKQLAAAAWCLANERLYCTVSDEANIIGQADGVDTTTLAYLFKNASNDRVSIFYKSDAATKYTDAAYLGQVLALTIGDWSGMAKNLPGESADDLTTTASNNAHSKYCNTYEERGAVNVVLNGWVSSGEYTDIIVFVDWLKARIQENIWNLFVNTSKIPYTDQGITTIQNAISQILRIGQSMGGVTPDSFNPVTKARTGGFVVTVPEAADALPADKAARILKNVTFVCWYSNGIHKVEIQGTVVL